MADGGNEQANKTKKVSTRENRQPGITINPPLFANETSSSIQPNTVKNWSHNKVC